MSNPFMKKWLAGALCALALGSTAALAEGDSFYLGTGRDLDYKPPAGSYTINSYARVAAPIGKGDTGIEVDSCTGSPCFAAGNLVMVLQTTGYVGTPEVKDSPPPFPMSNTEVGQWELARVKGFSGTTLELTAPLIRSYASGVTQVIRVPEYTDVIIGATTVIKARAWDGKVGGVVAFLATGLVQNDGEITATGTGFQGGLFVNGSSSLTGCRGDDLPALNGGAQKGEGIANLYFGDAHTGRGYVINGGGGGVCSRSGGGGGGNGGKGGMGGYASDAPTGTPFRDVGGRGGVALDLGASQLINRLVLGGGGGAGHGYAGNGKSGGSGGGIVFIRGNRLDGGGSIKASGVPGGSTTSDGASGGGAGGSIYLRFAGSASCLPDLIDASGGSGGGIPDTSRVGPGGGGGGGQVLFQATYDGTCHPEDSETIVYGATAGTQRLPTAPGGSRYGAQDGGDGIFKRLTGLFVAPSAPVVTVPTEGSRTRNPRPDFEGGTNESSATVVIFIDGVEVGSVPLMVPPGGSSPYPYFFRLPSGWPNLSDGSHKVEAVNEVDGIRGPKSPAVTFSVDTTPPVTQIVSGPVSPTNATSATFDFGVETPEDGVKYECRLEPETDFIPCSDPKTYTGLDEGSYRLWVRAVDALGNVDSTPERYEWTVDRTPPVTQIDSGPPGLTNATSATFDFDVETPESGVKYECKLDLEADFTPCTDPQTYTGLGGGKHTLLVRAVDALGNADLTPERYEWTVDLTPPVTQIDSGPPGLTNATSATFDFDVETPEDGVKYECKLDTEADFTPCTDPKTYTGLGEGKHTLLVRAVDALGNVDSTPESYEWTVDLTKPTVSIDSGPAGTTRDTSATFDFDSNEAAKGVTYLCRLDAEADFTPCPDPKTYTGLGEGPHTLQVVAVDTAGNMSAMPAVRTWTVDRTAPVTKIVAGPESTTRSTSATFDFDVETPEAGVTYECKLDTEADFTPCSDPKTYSDLGEGKHTLLVRAVDALGNVDSTPERYEWTVDTTKPTAPVVSPELEGATFDTSTPVITGTAEPGSTVTVIIDGVTVGTTTADTSGTWSYTPTTPLTEGSHQVKARATDPAGNEGAESGGRTFTIQDTTRPETTITSGPSGSTQERSATFEFGSNEPGVTYECSLDGAAYTPCTSPVTFNDLAPGEHTFRVRARDAAGNEDTTPETRTWTVTESKGNGGGDISFRGDGFGCSATGGDSTLVLMGLGTFLALARRRRRN